MRLNEMKEWDLEWLYPCKECIIKPKCTTVCSKAIKTPTILFESWNSYRICPFCGSFGMEVTLNKEDTFRCIVCKRIFYVDYNAQRVLILR